MTPKELAREAIMDALTEAGVPDVEEATAWVFDTLEARGLLPKREPHDVRVTGLETALLVALAEGRAGVRGKPASERSLIRKKLVVMEAGELRLTTTGARFVAAMVAKGSI